MTSAISLSNDSNKYYLKLYNALADRNGQIFTLGFPNEELKYGFIESLIPAYVEDEGTGSGKDIVTLRRYIEQGHLDKIKFDNLSK